MAKLFKAGDQVPEIPLEEVVGNGDKFSPIQTDWTAVKFGTKFPLTTIVIVTGHWPEFGVKV